MANLLLVDDDLDVVELLVDVLRSEGHEVRVARNGREGLELLADEWPDLVLLDVEMPVLSGPDMAYQMFVRDLGLERIPVLLVSGVLDLPRVAAAVGTPYFLAKPYTIEGVLALLARALVERKPPSPRMS